MPKSDENLLLTRVLEMMVSHGVTRVYAKVLAANDNSKNQPYFGGDFSVLNILPAGQPQPHSSGSRAEPIFKAPLRFGWLDPSGTVCPAPNAKLIMYPQYPEVRFSGYLQGCSNGPSVVMGYTARQPNRLLLLGVRNDGMIIGYAADPDSAVVKEFSTLDGLQRFGVFVQLPLPGISGAAADRSALLAELCRIAAKGWIRGKKLNADGTVRACNAQNCGGYTLEAELGIIPNSFANPDYRGWEVKQHAVTDFAANASGAITLMTPEPSEGFYTAAGVVAFVERYGYADRKGRKNRLNFVGRHVCENECAGTGLTLKLRGYDSASGKITDAGGGITLLDSDGADAAIWLYTGLMSHWNRKHATAAYIPCRVSSGVDREYQYARRVRLGTGTDFLRFLAALASGAVYYDPGIKVEGYPAKPRTKRRSQFRIKSRDLPVLYDRLETVDTCTT